MPAATRPRAAPQATGLTRAVAACAAPGGSTAAPTFSCAEVAGRQAIVAPAECGQAAVVLSAAVQQFRLAAGDPAAGALHALL